MKQLTLVAFYGPKPRPLANLLESLQSEVKRTLLGAYFTPYPIDQIHGTIIGLEKAAGASRIHNANFLKATGEEKAMSFPCLLKALEACLPLAVRIGGFARGYSGFQSFGDIPYRRAFSIHKNTGKVLFTGWPYTGDPGSFDFSRRRLLWQLRQELSLRCHIRHKYHEQEDNDLYMVLGTLNRPDGPGTGGKEQWVMDCRQLENRARAFLYHHPVHLLLSPDTLFVVQYETESLELAGSRPWPLREILKEGISWEQLYE